MLSKDQLTRLCALLSKGEHAIESNHFETRLNCRFVVDLGEGEGYHPFEQEDARDVECAMREGLCVVPDVIPYALPFSLAVQAIPDHIWKTAVQADKTQLGMVDYKAEYAREHALMNFLWELRA